MLEKELHQLVIAKDIATADVLTVTPEDNLNTALKKMAMAEIRELPVVSRGTRERYCPCSAGRMSSRLTMMKLRGTKMKGQKFDLLRKSES